MQAALRMTARVQPGGRIEITNPELPVGQAVDVIVLFSPAARAARRSIVDVLADAPGHLAFRTPEEVDAYLQEERQAWKR